MEDNYNTSSGDLMQFPSEDSDDSFIAEDNTMRSENRNNIPNKKSLGEHFAATTTKPNAAIAAAVATTTVKPVKSGPFDGSSKYDSSVAGTADMTDMEWLDHLEKIEVKITDVKEKADLTLKLNGKSFKDFKFDKNVSSLILRELAFQKLSAYVRGCGRLFGRKMPIINTMHMALWQEQKLERIKYKA